MNRISQISMALTGAALLVGATGCSDDPGIGTDPGDDTTALLSVNPQGGSTNVDPGSTISVEFSGPMQNGMEMYASMHEGDVTGPEVPGRWTWNGDHTHLGFSPASPLMPETQYTMHVGGGMMDQAGLELDLETHGPGMGGNWATDDMMGGMMGGHPHMGEGWEHSNGTFGMVFGFMTASGTTAFVSIVPVGGDTDVDPGATMSIEFSGPMQNGMEMYAAMHQGDVTGPEVAGTWTWNGDHTRLEFSPTDPLMAETQYTMHVGGGMIDQAGHELDLGTHGPGMGGDWATDDMMGGMMGGSHMGEGWQHSNDTYGMLFSFMTAPGVTEFVSIFPAGGDTNVDPNAPVVIEFDHPMLMGMEMYAALHEGDVTGPEVAGTWIWSDDDATLTFTPDQPLLPGTQYTVHLGGGMTDAHGDAVDFDTYGTHMGGEWATDDMMGGGMMGGGMMNGGMMGEGWQHSNGTYGMVFSFTTTP